jgi:hypothetical protein
LNFESKTHEAKLEDQKPKKSSRRSSRRRKNHKTSKWHKKRQTKQNGKEELRKAQKLTKLLLKHTPPNTLNASSPPLVDFTMFLLSTTWLAKSSTNFLHILSPFGNKIIKHNPREE